MNKFAQTQFKETCWQFFYNEFTFRHSGSILQHIKTVITPILCAVSGQQKYDVFFGCYNDWFMFKQLIEKQFNKPLYQHEQQNNQPPNTNKQNNNINNINNTIHINNNTNNAGDNAFISDIQHNNINIHPSDIKLNISNGSKPNIPGNDNKFQCPQCIPRCCVNLCAKICPNHIQQSQSRND